VRQREVDERLGSRWLPHWLLAYRAISSAKLERTIVATVLPRVAVNHKAPIMFVSPNHIGRVFHFLGILNSLVFDYIARQKIGGTDVGYFHIGQLPCPPPSRFGSREDDFVRPRILELVYTAIDMRDFAEALGWTGPPFKWDTDRRFVLQCELDAFYAHLFGLSRDDWRFVLDPAELLGNSYPGESFRVLKEKETDKFGEFRTSRRCLEFYDAMQRAAESGEMYHTILDPPPADPSVAHHRPESLGI
jgi:hypothetical protein